MTADQIKWAAYIMLSLALGFMFAKSRDASTKLLCICCAIAAFLLKVRIAP